jgi:hypothetical protein
VGHYLDLARRALAEFRAAHPECVDAIGDGAEKTPLALPPRGVSDGRQSTGDPGTGDREPLGPVR